MDTFGDAYSGASFERVELADGTHLVVKHLPSGGDWLTRAAGSTDHLRHLWESGALDRLRSVVDHAMVDLVRVDDHDVVVMRDVGEHLVPHGAPVSRAESRELLAGLVALHDAGRAEEAFALCPIGARYRMAAPAVHAVDDGPGPHPDRDRLVRGWEAFAELVDPEVASAVFAVHRDTELLGSPLGRFESTLLHGDPKLPNLGMGPAGLVAIDWGELTGFGPPAVDVAWYASANALRMDATADDVFDDYQSLAGRPLEPESIELALIGVLAQSAYAFAGVAARARDPEMRAEFRTRVDWWDRRVKLALDRVGGLGS
jgi:hypothetical protein